MKRIFIIVLLAIPLLFIGLLIYINTSFPKVSEAKELKVEQTPERVERGAYLANAVMACTDCHSTRDWGRYAGPIQEGTLGKGGEHFTPEMGFPGTFISPNITPFALKDWTDGEIFRAITEGVNKDGKALFPVMPHPNYGQLDKEDIYDVIAYLRSLEPVESYPEKSKPSFPMSLIVKTIPKPADFKKRPESHNQLAYGEYLFNAASCTDCHTPMEKGKYDLEMYLAGGNEFPMPGGKLRAPNITPDKESGIGNWTETQFVERFKMYTDSSYTSPKVSPTDFNTIMPWLMYGQMEETDLEAIFAYLQTVKPIKNKVVLYEPNN